MQFCERRLAMVALRSQVTVFLASYAWKSRERNDKKANEFLPLVDQSSICLWQEAGSAHVHTSLYAWLLMQHASYCYGIHTLARITQLEHRNSEPPPLGPGCTLFCGSNMQYGEEVLQAKWTALRVGNKFNTTMFIKSKKQVEGFVWNVNTQRVLPLL